ncbi:MAG: family 16 glycosylhydrolase [Victivallales bacterium]|nr:family 16 glycosylhydrolase [Victivallales bacterium]
MKNLTLFMLLLVASAFALEDVTGQWKNHTWEGYKPLPNVMTQDGVVSIENVTSKNGFALMCKKNFAAKSGDRVVLNATVKGKGNITLRIQCYAKNPTTGKDFWTGVPKVKDKIAIPTEWENVQLAVPVVDMPKGMTSKVVVTLHLDKGNTLQLKESGISIEEGDVSGNIPFPNKFTVFEIGHPDEMITFPLDKVPAELYGVKPSTLTLDNNIIAFPAFKGKSIRRQNAVLYATINAPSDTDYDIGAGADYFFAYYINGEKVLDTLQGGDNSDTPHFTTHRAKLKLKKGDNLLVIHFQSGKGKNPRISLGGARDLRNLSQVLEMEETFEEDDYEKEGTRHGSPKIVQGILTDGIETKSGQAIYPKGAEIVSAKEYALPSKAGEKYFAMGLRVCRFPEMGSIDFSMGKDLVMKITRQELYAKYIDVAVHYKGKQQKSIRIPFASLPNDFLFAVSATEYYVNVSSLNDSRLRSFNGKLKLDGMGSFPCKIRFNTENSQVDEYKLGMAKRKIRTNNVPMKLDLLPTFDPVKAGWKMVWHDEFDGTEVDWKNNWMNTPWSPDAPATVAKRKYATLKDGMLHIRCEWKDKREDGTYIGNTVGMYSRRHFGYGYYEARVRFTKRPGWWAAFWLYNEGRNCQLGGGFEIDIFEDYSTRGGEPIIASNLHVQRGPNQNSYGSHFRLPGTLDDFYVIGVKWTPFEVSTYVNGKLMNAKSQHTPLDTLTYDALNHAFSTSKHHLCVSAAAKTSGGRSREPGMEEYLVDYVRAYEYPMEKCPKVKWTQVPKTCVKDGEKIRFAAEAERDVEVAYLFDNGFLVDYKTEKPYVFDWIMDMPHYKDTRWYSAGRSGRIPVFDCYPHIFRICVQDKDGNVGMTDAFPVIVGVQPGEPIKVFDIPGTIKATSFNKGGQNVCSYKQHKASTIAVGAEVHSRKELQLREAGEYVSYTVDVKKAGTYKVKMTRWNYRRQWETTAMLIADGKYVGKIIGQPNTDAAYGEVELKAGKQNLILVSAGTYGIQPEDLIFELK